MLSCAIDGGDPAVAELVRKLGAEGAWAKIIEGVLGEPTAQRAVRVRVEVFERLATAAAARFVIPGNEEWPAGLGDLRHAESIQRRGGEPVGLLLRGPGHLAHLMERSVAIVGSRAATAYGNGIAADLAADLVDQGGAPTLWAGAPGSHQIAHGLPGDNAALTFRFAPGVEAYGKLVSKPGLTATVVLDREICRIMGVRFLNVSRT
jgi:DNA processing protein